MSELPVFIQNVLIQSSSPGYYFSRNSQVILEQVNSLIGIIDLKPFHLNMNGGVGCPLKCTDVAAALNRILGEFDAS
jgi:hypothetical protein